MWFSPERHTHSFEKRETANIARIEGGSSSEGGSRFSAVHTCLKNARASRIERVAFKMKLSS
eukprot:429237-Pyramimonas_sp.AAC.1